MKHLFHTTHRFTDTRRMALIAIAEDDPGTRKLLSVVLQRMGHEVVEAGDGDAAWALVREHRPAVIVSDVEMPGMSGFGLLEKVRQDADLALTPFILLTSLQERKSMRQGMRMGADDYITKPFQSDDLRDAVAAQLNKQEIRHAAQAMALKGSLESALEEQARDLIYRYEDQLAHALNEQWPSQRPGEIESHLDHATVLYVELSSYPEWVARLSANELSVLLKRFYEGCGDTVFLFGAATMQFVGEGVLALFSPRPEETATASSLRAARAALGLRASVGGLRSFVDQQFQGRALPQADLGVCLHSGPVSMMRLEGLLGGATQLVPVGETVVDTQAIQRHALTESGRLTVSVPVLRSIMGAVQPGKRQLLNLPHRSNPVDVCEVLALGH
jgi:CheY-like chemotaxis protein/class 3 adenylate cyclase